jgi:hypothetical protein
MKSGLLAFLRDSEVILHTHLDAGQSRASGIRAITNVSMCLADIPLELGSQMRKGQIQVCSLAS